jgi:hypothetical protein
MRGRLDPPEFLGVADVHPDLDAEVVDDLLLIQVAVAMLAKGSRVKHIVHGILTDDAKCHEGARIFVERLVSVFFLGESGVKEAKPRDLLFGLLTAARGIVFDVPLEFVVLLYVGVGRQTAL